MSTGTITLPLTATPVVIENGLTPYVGQAVTGAVLFANDSGFVDTSEGLNYDGDTLNVSTTINTTYFSANYISNIIDLVDDNGVVAFNFGMSQRQFNDQTETTFLDGNERSLFSIDGPGSPALLTFTDGVIIYSPDGNESIDGNARLLTNGGQANTLSWNNGIEITDENGNPLADFLDSSGVALYGLLTLASGGIQMPTVGKGVALKGGTNARIGTLTLNGTTAVVVANTTVTANTRIMLTTQTGAGTVGAPYISARVNGTSFSVKSTAVGDTSTCGYVLFEQI